MKHLPPQLLVGALRFVEHVPIPDTLLKASIAMFIGMRDRDHEPIADRDKIFADLMSSYPIALHAEAANAQHYELPEEFFGLTLGPNRKYSCCYYPQGHETLAEAERLALEKSAERAFLTDGQQILELGCGWGSFSLFVAEQFSKSHITAVSNSQSQRSYIEEVARERGLKNLKVLTADMNTFQPQGPFDRIVSIEMFEHMANWGALLARLKKALKPEGRLFIHIFSHKATPYRFDHTDPTDWIGRYFFTGGFMPSDTLLRQFEDHFSIEEEWRWNGTHYEKTALDWLKNFDKNAQDIMPILQKVYGVEARVWKRRWRLFYLATAGLFGFANGEEWGVKHYLLKPAN
ncbi:MAG: SAM-dependent methyltransferase [Hyphomicrobium sp.]